jgi:enediyne biosynthesis protein E4
LNLKASKGNPQAIGAKIWLTAGGITQRREIRANNSYASSSDLRPLFGLGKTAQVDEVKIRWTSGKTTVLKNPPVDQLVQVEEPQN